MSVVYYLLGAPAVGKRTIARALSGLTGAVCVDNQTVNLPVIGLFAWDGKSALPPEIWTHVDTVRDAMLSVLEHLAPAHLSYVLTNTLEDDARSRALFRRIEAVAAARGSRFVPVFLTCDPEEQLLRVVSQDRVERSKMSDREGARAYIEATSFYEPVGPRVLRLDTTRLLPAAAATLIASHGEQVRGQL